MHRARQEARRAFDARFAMMMAQGKPKEESKWVEQVRKGRKVEVNGLSATRAWRQWKAGCPPLNSP